jgi:hypothetical protein
MGWASFGCHRYRDIVSIGVHLRGHGVQNLRRAELCIESEKLRNKNRALKMSNVACIENFEPKVSLVAGTVAELAE